MLLKLYKLYRRPPPKCPPPLKLPPERAPPPKLPPPLKLPERLPPPNDELLELKEREVFMLLVERWNVDELRFSMLRRVMLPN